MYIKILILVGTNFPDNPISNFIIHVQSASATRPVHYKILNVFEIHFNENHAYENLNIFLTDTVYTCVCHTCCPTDCRLIL